MLKRTESMNVDELNDLISVAHARIASLQKKLDHLEHSEKERMKSAMDAQRRADESLREQYVRQELDLERSRHDIERHKWKNHMYVRLKRLFSSSILKARVNKQMNFFTSLEFSSLFYFFGVMLDTMKLVFGIQLRVTVLSSSQQF
ncbi:unnamed protein product [Trichobilharzia regenti]|nr:unnamed protein product [Trichobilharzia regenti]